MYTEIKKEIELAIKQRWNLNSISEMKQGNILSFKATFPKLYSDGCDSVKTVKSKDKYNISEVLYIIDNNIQSRVVCEYCKVNFVNFANLYYGYYKTCCKKCSNKCIAENLTHERKKELSEKFKLAAARRSPEKEAERKRKEKETKSKRTEDQILASEKKRLDKYYSKSEEEKLAIRKKRSLSHLNKSDEEKAEIEGRRATTKANKSAEEKAAIELQKYLTKKQNGTFNTSKLELEHYSKIKEIYPNTEQQYTDKIRYPFACDFYISELDLFIEINDAWFHEAEPFDKTNKRHIDVVLDWFKRSKELNHKGKPKESYKYAIKVWTQSDPLKLLTAKQNNLNFLTIYPKDRPNLLELIQDSSKWTLKKSK